MTRRTFQAANTPQKIEPSSPEQLHSVSSVSSVETFDTMSALSTDSSYMTQRQHRHNPSWTSSQYSDLVGSYTSQSRNPYTIQTQFTVPKANPSLPSIRDLTTYNQPYPSATSYYSTSGGTYPSTGDYTIKSEPYVKTEGQQGYYNLAPRIGQDYQSMNRPTTTGLDYHQPRSTYGWPVSYPAPYSDYGMTSTTGGHPPISPTVSTGGDCHMNARRRRGNLPKHITDYLKSWFLAHLEHPYPSEDDKQEFVRRTNLSIAQVCTRLLSRYPRLTPANNTTNLD
jgi:hypothetical protein